MSASSRKTFTRYGPKEPNVLFYFGTKYSSRVSGKKVKAVTCERCQTEFWYEIARTATGLATAHYMLFRERARQRAEDMAHARLAKRLESQVELVPCPHCNWVNSDVVKKYRKGTYGWVPMVGLLILFVSLFLATIAGGKRGPSPLAWAILGIGFTSPAWLCLIRVYLRGKLNPNSTYPNTPSLPPGTPVAWVQTQDADGATHLTPCPRPETDSSLEEGLVYCAGQIDWPSVCCVCLAPSTTTYAPVWTFDRGREPAVPLCQTCALSVRKGWWKSAYLIVGAFIIPGALLSMIVATCTPGTSVWIVPLWIAGLGAFIAVGTLTSRFSRPFRYRMLNKERGLVRFVSANDGFNRLLVEQLKGFAAVHDPSQGE
jgi:hypothetical protein